MEQAIYEKLATVFVIQKNGEKMIFKRNQSKRFHIISIIIGVLLATVGTIIYFILYKNEADRFSYENIVYMIVCIEAIMFGIVLELINFEDNLREKLVLVILGFLIAGFIFDESFRCGIILLMVAVTAYSITMRFKNIFSTVVTMSVFATIFLILTLFVLKVVDENYGTLVLYCIFSLFIVIYRKCGVIINQWFIDKMLGFEEESKTYDDEQLKNQILLIYMLAFIFLNVWLYLRKIDNETWDLINNSFLTGLAIIQINWNKIVFYFRKTSSENIAYEEKSNKMRR